jgi:hypothetical protein
VVVRHRRDGATTKGQWYKVGPRDAPFWGASSGPTHGREEVVREATQGAWWLPKHGNGGGVYQSSGASNKRSKHSLSRRAEWPQWVGLV